MPIQNKDRQQGRTTLSTAEQLARLRSEVGRLRAEIRQLKAKRSGANRDRRPATRTRKRGTRGTGILPGLPPCDADGNYPAIETLRAILAQQIIQRREAVGWTQVELAERAGVRQETVSRIESGKNAPNVATVDKLDRALRTAGV